MVPTVGKHLEPGGVFTKNQYKEAATSGGFNGNVVVGTDLASITIKNNARLDGQIF